MYSVFRTLLYGPSTNGRSTGKYTVVSVKLGMIRCNLPKVVLAVIETYLVCENCMDSKNRMESYNS